MEHGGTPVVTSVQEEDCPLRTSLCFVFLKKSNDRFKKSPDMPLFQFRNKTIMPYFIKSYRYIEEYTTNIKTIIKQLVNFVND